MNTQLKLNQTRRERRRQQRIGEDLNTVFQLLCDEFTDFFVMHSNPEGEDVQQFAKRVSTRWIVYCKSKNIIPKLHTAMDEFIDKQFNEYKQTIDRKGGVGRNL